MPYTSKLGFFFGRNILLYHERFPCSIYIITKKLIYEHIDVATVNMSFTDNLDLQDEFIEDVALLPYLGSSLNASTRT